jgi:NADP-dependent 3-hydroxy acid dehydrogenase YdfG
VRVTTVDPGLVETEFSIVRFRGDAERAKRLYEGLRPVTPEDVADCVLFAVTRPPNIDVDEIVIKALVQTSGGRILKPEEAERVT